MKYTKTSAVSAATILTIGLFASPALAHSGGHGTGFLAGLVHPVSGIDHLLAMVAVGLWAATRPAKTALYGPLTFLAMMFAGSLLGFGGVVLPFLEAGIIASVVFLGLMIVMDTDLPVKAAYVLIGAFALLHGQAHAIEATTTGLPFIGSMLAMTAVLHLLGFGLGRRLHRFKFGVWMAGSVIAAGGLALITT